MIFHDISRRCEVEVTGRRVASSFDFGRSLRRLQPLRTLRRRLHWQRRRRCPLRRRRRASQGPSTEGSAMVNPLISLDILDIP